MAVQANMMHKIQEGGQAEVIFLIPCQTDSQTFASTLCMLLYADSPQHG